MHLNQICRIKCDAFDEFHFKHAYMKRKREFEMAIRTYSVDLYVKYLITKYV